MWPVLEITVQHAASKKFQQRARRSKIPKDYQATSQASQTHINRTALQRGFTPANHLEIEWHELFLTDTAATYQKILEFLNCTGNVEQFVDQVNDYVNRNNLLLQETYESYSLPWKIHAQNILKNAFHCSTNQQVVALDRSFNLCCHSS